MNYKFDLDYNEIIKRSVKYLIIALVVALASNNIPENKINLNETLIISITAACTFAIVDMYAPTVSNTTTLNINKKKLN
jgi:ABC-type Co2+ transport system permease subunit